MAKVEFNYNGTITAIQCLEEEKMEEIYKKFETLSNLDINKINFLYSGKKINSQLTFSQIISDSDKDRKSISIIVEDLNKGSLNNDSNIIKSIFPICPKCKEKVPFEIEDYKISYLCKNGHSTKMLINEYEKNQFIDLSKIFQNKNDKNKYNFCENEINLKNISEIQLCPLCSNKYDEKNNKNNYFSKDYICKKHIELYSSYCKECKNNICMKCVKEHKNHNIIYYGEIIPDKGDLLNKLKDFRKEIDIYNKDIIELINKLNNVKENLEKLYNIYSEMINKYDDQYRNYEIFMSLNTINNNIIINDIKEINNISLFKDKIEKILNIYEKINFYYITISYNNSYKEEIKIFGKTFVNNNKSLCKIFFKNREYELREKLKTESISNFGMEIKLTGINYINDLSYIFHECSELSSISHISKWDTSNIKDMQYMFFKCDRIWSIPDISDWNIKNVTKMNHMFYECSWLRSLPDISKWDTSNVTNLKSMFSGCKSLESLPDISQWNTYNVKDMSFLFQDCSSLKSLPDISSWNTSKVINMEYMFYNCCSLHTLPDIFKWDISNVSNISYIFYGCSSLYMKPYLSKWNLKKVKEKENMV